MKILTVTVSLDPRDGGKPARAIQFSQALHAAGFGASILSTSKGIDRHNPPFLDGVPITILSLISQRFFVPIFRPGFLSSLVQQYDIVHLMGWWNILNYLVWLAARRASIPVVVCPAGELAMAGRSRWLKRVFQYLVGRQIIATAQGYIAIAENEIDQFIANGVFRDNVKLLPNGIEPASLHPGNVEKFRLRFGLGTGPLILFIGRLDPVKGPDLILEAFLLIADEFPHHSLLFAGPDNGALTDLYHILKGHAASSRVYFVGYLNAEDKATAYKTADLVVVPSRQEVMSMIVLEAGLLKKAVLMTDQCGLERLAKANAVHLVPATIAGLRVGLEALLEDSTKRGQLGARLHAETHSKYTWERVMVDASAFFFQVGDKA